MEVLSFMVRGTIDHIFDAKYEIVSVTYFTVFGAAELICFSQSIIGCFLLNETRCSLSLGKDNLQICKFQ